MSDRIKKIKIKQTDGTFSDYIPIGANAKDIDLQYNDSNVENTLKKKPYYYDNVAAMKLDDTLREGDMAITLGYYEINDGGGAEYRIVSNEQSDDGGSIHELSSGLKAQLIIRNDTVNVNQFGAKGDGKQDDTQAIQNAINISKNIIFLENHQYMINTSSDDENEYAIINKIDYNGGITVPSNRILKGMGNSILKAIPTDKDHGTIFRSFLSKNITYENLEIIGEKDEHLNLESRHFIFGITILNCENIFISNCKISNFYGDCIFLEKIYNQEGAYNDYDNKNIIIKDSIISEALRNGLTIADGINIQIIGNTFLNNGSTDPKSAIDIEPECPAAVVHNLLIDNCYFMENVFGISLLLGAENNRNITNLYENVNISNCSFYESSATPIIIFGSTYQTTYGDINFNNISSYNCGYAGVSIRNKLEKNGRIKFKDITIYNSGTNFPNALDNAEGLQSTCAISCYRSGVEYEEGVTEYMGNIYFENLSAIDNQSKMTMKGYLYCNDSANYIQNIYLINPKENKTINSYNVMKKVSLIDGNKVMIANKAYYQSTWSTTTQSSFYYSSGTSDRLRLIYIRSNNFEQEFANNSSATFINDSNKHFYIAVVKNKLIEGNRYEHESMPIYPNINSGEYYYIYTTEQGAQITLTYKDGSLYASNIVGQWTATDSLHV